MALRVIELFAGVGGFHLALEEPTFRTVWSSQWEPGERAQWASKCYQRHFPDTPHSNVDIATVPASEIPEHDLLVGGFPCFAAGTMVLTRRGYAPIETVTIADEVLTHLGRWRRVTAMMRREGAPLRKLLAGGVPGLVTTDEHPFWARERAVEWSTPAGRNVRRFELPAWIAAEKLQPGTHFLSQVLPPEETQDEHPAALWWVIGRYLADGWRTVSNGKGRVVICCAHDEADALAARLEAAGLHASRSAERSVVKFHVTRRWFYDLLEPFGRYAEGKTLPGSALALDAERSRALLEGYLSGDGAVLTVGTRTRSTLQKAGSTSKALALGIALLAQRVHGVVAGVHHIRNARRSVVIEGREVQERPYWQVHIPASNRSAFVEGRYGWKLLRKSEPCGTGTVYNISVAEDESYVADGAVVHNCQDYSVATTKAAGISGKKGVLWWEIDRIVRARKPTYVLLENVDRLLRSPTKQRGRDFGIVLRSLTDAGYRVEWRALNAADHGFPQKRRRVFIFAARADTPWGRFMGDRGASAAYLQRLGFFPRAFPVREETVQQVTDRPADVVLPEKLQAVSDAFEAHFLASGVCVDGAVWTAKPHPESGPVATLGSVLDRDVAEEYCVPEADLPRWKYLKGAKAEERKAATGYNYHYKEGAIPFPDRLDQPARTILTHEGARSPSRFNHIIQDPIDGRFRRLTPEECEKLNGFPAGWTEGMPERRRYFCMGNALVVGLVKRMGETLEATRKDPAKGVRVAMRRREKVEPSGVVGI